MLPIILQGQPLFRPNNRKIDLILMDINLGNGIAEERIQALAAAKGVECRTSTVIRDGGDSESP